MCDPLNPLFKKKQKKRINLLLHKTFLLVMLAILNLLNIVLEKYVLIT